MIKVHVIGHRRRLDDVLAFLYARRALHLVDVTDDPDVPLPPFHLDDAEVREIEDLRYLQARLDALLSLVPHPPRSDRSPEEIGDRDLANLRDELDELAPELERLVHRLDELEDEREVLPQYVASLRRLLPLLPEATELAGYDTAALLVDIRYADVLAELNASLTDLIGGNFEIISAAVDADTLGAVLVYPRPDTAEVRSLLGREQLTQVRLPTQFRALPFARAITAMERRLAELPGEIGATGERIDDLVGPHGNWTAGRDHVVARLDQLGAVRHFGATQHTFVVSGWLPEDELSSLPEDLAHDAGPEVVVDRVAATDDDVPPVLMANRSPARPFQFLVGLLGLPRYGTLDPTWLMAMFLPLFFGIMLGDVGYGLVLLALMVAVHRRFGARSAVARDLSVVLMMSAAWAVVWGFVYGEFFGDLGRRLFDMQPIWIDREEAIEPLLVFALAIGAAHVTLGLVLGGLQAVRSRRPHLLAERAAMLAALIGLFLLVGVAAGQLPSAVLPPAAAAVLVALVVLMALGGAMGLLMGPLELLGTVGNVLSYLRLAAIGLASVYLARVANELGAAAPLLLGIIVAALFHALNLALGAFSPTIQSLRLHYVEFFSKFFDPGGEPYRPFGGEAPPSRQSAT